MGGTERQSLAELRAELHAAKAELEHRLAEQYVEFERRLAERDGGSEPGSSPVTFEAEVSVVDADVPCSRRWLLAAGAGAAAASVAGVVGEASPAAAVHQAEDLGLGITNTSTSRTVLTSAAGAGSLLIQNTGSNPAIVAESAFLGLQVTGAGRIFQYANQGSPPSGTTFYRGEQVRSSDGQMWICTGDGNPGTWQKVAAAAPGASGGSLNMLASPFRLWDSRPGFISVLTTPKGVLNGSVQLQVTGNGGVPAKSIGIAGTITVTETQGASYAQVYPSSVPTTSNVNWTGPNQTVAASFIAALDSSGKVKVNAATPTQVVIDIAGFVY